MVRLVNEAVTEEQIASVVSLVGPGVPMERMLEGERSKLLRMEDDAAPPCGGAGGCAAGGVSDAVRRARGGLAGPATGRSGAFLFLGPTGVGKTELTKASGRASLFDDDRRRCCAST